MMAGDYGGDGDQQQTNGCAGSAVQEQWLTDQESVAAQVIRDRLRDKLPKRLATDLNLRRWLRAHDHDLDRLLPHMQTYLSSRIAAGYDRDDIPDIVMQHPLSKKFLKYFSVSYLGERALNEKDNSIVFLQKMENVDFLKVLKSMKASDLLKMYFLYNEYYLHLILRQEEKTGQPSSTEVLFDLTGMHITEFVNPVGPLLKVGRLMSQLWQHWYGEQITRILVVNPPRVVSLVWQLAKHLLNQRLQNRVHLITDFGTQLPRHLSLTAIPVAYGGQLRDNFGWGLPETCVNQPQPVEDSELYHPTFVIDEIRAANESLDSAVCHESIGHNRTFTVVRTVATTDQMLYYRFITNSEVQFTVAYYDKPPDTPVDSALPLLESDLNLVHPSFPLVTACLPEEGFIECEKPGEYHFRFSNIANLWMALKLDYVVLVLDKSKLPDTQGHIVGSW